MAHYAFLDDNNIVTQVIVGKDEDDDSFTDWEKYYGNFHNQKCLRTSYNTFAGEHNLGGTPFRKNYAVIGYSYDEQRDAFIPPKPYNSWSLNEFTCRWDPPTPRPNDGKNYIWNEAQLRWDLINI